MLIFLGNNMKRWYVFISILLVSITYISLSAYAKSSQTFSAGVVAQEQIFPIKELQLGYYARCVLVSAQKEDAFYSACYLKKQPQSSWLAESAGARCEIKCTTHLDKNGHSQTTYFTAQ